MGNLLVYVLGEMFALIALQENSLFFLEPGIYRPVAFSTSLRSDNVTTLSLSFRKLLSTIHKPTYHLILQNDDK